MSKSRILHMLAPGDNVSPFDVNMAADAGFEIIVPYRGVTVESVTGLIQDAIFSRPPKRFNYTGAFIGGYDVNLAADMLAKAKKALVPPFELSVFADPNGAYTTSAALVALVARHLKARGQASFKNLNAMVFGGGPVGLCTAVLIAQQGGNPHLVRLTASATGKHEGITRFAARYGVELPSIDGQTEAARAAALQSAHIAITAAKAGVQVLSKALLEKAPALMVVADVNAVPPSGIEGLKPNDNGMEIPTAGGKALGIGALAIGKIKYDAQNGLFKRMLDSEKAVCLDFPDAYQLAVQLAG